MPEAAPQLSDLVETTAKATAEVRDKVEAVEKTLKAVNDQFEALDGVDKDTVTKASADAADAVQGIRDLQAQIKSGEWIKSLEEKYDAQKDRIGDLELEVARAANGDPMPGTKNGQIINFSEYHKQLGKNLRQPKRVWDFDQGVQTAEAQKMVNLYAPHLDAEAKDAVVKTLIAGFATEGGVWVPAERSAQIIRRLFESNPMRQIASVMSTGTDMVEMVIDDGELSAVWGGELHNIQNTPTPKLGLLKIAVHELYARPSITLKMLEDASIDVVGWLTDKATDRFNRTESTGFVVGDGAEKPKGVLAYPDYTPAERTAGYGRGHIEQVASGANGELGPVNARGDGLFRLQNALKEPYQSGAVWLTRRANFFNFQTIKGSDGQYLFRFGDALAQGIGQTVLGRPLFFADDMQEFAADSLSVAYGNFQQGYTIVDRMGITVLVDPLTQDPNIRYRFRKRVGGAVTNYEAFKILRLSA